MQIYWEQAKESEIESVGLVYFASPFGCEHKLGINGVRGPIYE